MNGSVFCKESFMTYKEITETLKQILGKKLVKITSACDMLMLTFEDCGALHIQCICRIRKDEEIVITNEDYHLDSEEAYFEKLNKSADLFCGQTALEIALLPLMNLTIRLSDGIEVEVINDVAESDGHEYELWRFIDKGKRHLVVTDKTAELLG